MASLKGIQLKGVVNHCFQLTVKKIRTQMFVFRFEKEAVRVFFSHLDSAGIREQFIPYLVTKVQCVQFKSTREEFLKQTHDLMKIERKEQEVGHLLCTICLMFNDLPQPMKRNVVSRILQYFFLEIMVKMEVGVDNAVSMENAKVERERKKVELLGSQHRKRNPFANITNSKVITENTPVTRYVAGYCAFQLVKNKKCPPNLVKMIVKDKIPSSLDVTEPDKTGAWIVKLSRGGLISVTDEMFNLIQLIKKISDLIYVTDVSKIRNQNLKTRTIQHIFQNSEINELWNSMYSENDSRKWLLKLVDCFLNTRGKVLVRDLLEQYQYETKETLKAKKALRKSLLEKSQESKIQPTSTMKPNIKKSRLSVPVKVLERQIPTIQIPNTEMSSERLVKFNEHSEYKFLNGDPDLDLFLQFIPPEDPTPTIQITDTDTSTKTLVNINEHSEYSFLNNDPDLDLFVQFLPQ